MDHTNSHGPEQFPNPVGPPPREALRAYRDALRSHLQKLADEGDELSAMVLPQLDPDPLDDVRDEVQEFLDTHQPSR